MNIRRLAASILIFPVLAVIQAQSSQAQPSAPAVSSTTVNVSAPAPAPADPEVVAAMQAAVQGDTSRLVRLLASPKASEMRLEVQKWVVSHPTPVPQVNNAKAKANVGPNRAGPLNTGEYDYYCTGYDGQTLGWNGNSFHACHGYLDSYISGSQAGHYVPDAYDPGNQMSVACAHAYAGAAFFSLGLLTGGAIDALGTVVAIGGGGWSVEEMWISCGRTS